MNRPFPLSRSEKHKNKQIHDEATQWYAVMEDDSRVADNLPAFTVWLDADPRHQAVFQELCTSKPAPIRTALWSALGLLPRLIRRPAAMLTAAACLALALTFWPGADIVVPYGQWQDSRPGDGSELRFGPGSQANLDFTSERRLITLDSGSVIVEAAKNPNRPLIVQTPSGAVRVVGTRFTVIVDSRSTEISVTRGEVRVTPADQPDAGLSVLPTQRVHMTRTLAARDPNTAIQPEESLEGWRTVTQAPLADLTTALERETGQHVLLAPTPAVRAVSVSGRFYIRNPDATLSQLVNAYGLHRADAPFGVTLLY